jgi:hypothetical protein
MKDPKVLDSNDIKSIFGLPAYEVTNEGLTDSGEVEIKLCKGNKADETAPRQRGVFTESLLQMCKEYLEHNNKGELYNEHTTAAVEHINKSLQCLQDRADDRKKRGVQATYKK